MVQLVPFKTTDLERLVTFVRRYYETDGIVFDAARVRPALQTLLTDSRWGRAWELLAEGAVVGYAVVGFGFDHEMGGRLATLTDLFIEGALRGKGYGRAALAAIENACRAEGVAAMELQVENHNQVGRRLYESVGFSAFDRTPMWKAV